MEVEAVLSPRVAFFPDCFLEVNGVARTSAALDAFARERHLPFLTVHGGPDLCEAYGRDGGRLQLPRSRVSLTLEVDLSCDLLVWRHARRVRRALRLFQPDVVHITGPNDMSQIGAWTAWRLGVPIVASWHTNVHEFAARRVAQAASRLPPAVREALARQIEGRVLDLAALLYRAARVILAPSPELVDLLERRTGRPARLMRRGIDAEAFSPRWRTARDGMFRLGYVGRLSPEKNVRLLADIERALLARQVPPFRFVIVGFGSEQDWLAQNLHHAELRGVLTGEALSRAYADMDVFLFPSTTDTFGNAVLEALASGTPAVVTNAGGPRTIVEDGRSGVVAEGASGFADAITMLITQPGRLQAMRAAARDRARQFSWMRIFEDVYDAYADALAPGGCAVKSLHLTNAYHPTSGGIRTWYHQVLAAAGDHGWEARLVVPAASSHLEDVTPHARIHHVAAPRAPVFDRRYRLVLPHRYLLPRGAVRRILLAEQPDVVEIADKYSLNWLAGFIRKGLIPGLKRPVLVGFSFERMDDNVAAFIGKAAVLGRLAPLYMQRCYWPLFDAHLGASEYTAAELRPAASRHARRLYVQPCGVQVTGFDPAQRSPALRGALIEACGGGPDTRLLLYAGRLSPEKNTRLLVEMMMDLQSGPGDFRLVIAGSGPLLEPMRRQAARLKPGTVVFRGQVQDRRELASLYATCDAFVHPNPREPFGIAPLEAMASGCPVVLPDSGGVLTYADESNAWLAPPIGAAFAAAVRALHADPAQAQRRADRARETARRYDTSRMVARLFGIYSELVRNAQALGSTTDISRASVSTS